MANTYLHSCKLHFAIRASAMLVLVCYGADNLVTFVAFVCLLLRVGRHRFSIRTLYKGVLQTSAPQINLVADTTSCTHPPSLLCTRLCIHVLRTSIHLEQVQYFILTCTIIITYEIHEHA